MNKKILNQALPLILAVVTLLVLSLIFYGSINILNLFGTEKISLQVLLIDILVGLTIYLKTSIDFAIFMAGLMHKFPGVKNRIAIEVGTAAGNAAGTIIVMIIWFFFKEATLLLAAMVFFAALVLLRLAQDSLEHIFEDSNDDHKNSIPKWVVSVAKFLNAALTPINKLLDPIMSRVLPKSNINSNPNASFWGVLGLAFTVPFILGLDDFAGYVPLFKVVNVFGFGLGVFLGHAILNILLFLNPRVTVKVLKNPIIAILGAVAFILLALYGLFEVAESLHIISFVEKLFH
jgi:uncharacterized membrane protein